MVSAARDVSFTINRAETLGIVGESGCGKSTVAFGIVSFLGSNGRITGGSVLFEEQELETLRDYLGRICHNIKDEFCRKQAKS